jgi:hypothetical protein
MKSNTMNSIDIIIITMAFEGEIFAKNKDLVA